MKTLRAIGMALLAVFVCVNFAACSDDDDAPQPLADLVGTVWAGTSPFTGYGVEVSVGGGSKCVVKVYKPNSSEVYDREECGYTYDESTGAFTCGYSGYTITGWVSGNTMTFTDEYGTYTLTRKAQADDEATPPGPLADLTGTVWAGTNPFTGYGVEVSIGGNSKCVVTVYKPGSSEIYDREECLYAYNESTGTFSCTYGGYTIRGKIKGNVMTFTDEYGTYDITRR